MKTVLSIGMALCMALASMPPVHAQGTDATLKDRQRVLNDAQSSTALDAQQRKALVDQAANKAQPSTIKIPDAPKGTISIDPERIARQYSEIKGPEKREKETNELMVFVSTSMPTASLEKVAAQSRQASAMIVMRGASKGVGPGKWIASVQAMKPLTDNGGEVFLYPEMFERYGIKRVPAIVVAPDAQGGCSEDACREYAVVYGDVSLDYALERLVDRKDSVGAIARARLAKMKKK